MNAAAFLIALRRRARVISTHPDPLPGALTFLEENGDTGEGRMLLRIIETLATGGGQYSESEVYLLSEEMLAVAVALIEARGRGFYSEHEWRGHFPPGRVGPDGKLTNPERSGSGGNGHEKALDES